MRIDSVRTDSGLVARVLTKDGWSTQVDYRFRSAGGQVEFTIGLIENNLLGTASSAAVRYRKTTDRSTVALAFRRPRLFAGRIGIGAQYEDRSDGRLAALLLEQPFFALTSPFAFSLSGEDHDERVLRFFDGRASGERHAEPTVHHRARGRGVVAQRLGAGLCPARPSGVRSDATISSSRGHRGRFHGR